MLIVYLDCIPTLPDTNKSPLTYIQEIKNPDTKAGV